MQKKLYIPLTITSSSVIVTPTRVTAKDKGMIKFFYKLFNHNKIDDLNKQPKDDRARRRDIFVNQMDALMGGHNGAGFENSTSQSQQEWINRTDG